MVETSESRQYLLKAIERLEKFRDFCKYCNSSPVHRRADDWTETTKKEVFINWVKEGIATTNQVDFVLETINMVRRYKPEHPDDIVDIDSFILFMGTPYFCGRCVQAYKEGASNIVLESQKDFKNWITSGVYFLKQITKRWEQKNTD